MNWRKLGQDEGLLLVLERYQVLFFKDSVQNKVPHSAKCIAEQIKLLRKSGGQEHVTKRNHKEVPFSKSSFTTYL